VRYPFVVLAFVGASTAACSHGWDTDGYDLGDAPRAWVTVARDHDVTVALDTAHSNQDIDSSIEVWYRTEHRRPRSRAGRAWNREITLSLLRCDLMAFKTVMADYFDVDGNAVARQRASKIDVIRQPWRPVPRGSLEEMAAQAGCRYFGHASMAGPASPAGSFPAR